MPKTITLFCSAGMSTSLLVNKMKEAAAAQGKDYIIAAYSLNEVDQYGPLADVILIGPQVRFALAKLKAQFPDKPIDSIDMRMYGLMDGKGALAVAQKYLGE
ncbi:MAG: PTS sugar transporter subunit IIB [Solobacterium sp.]|nr:PTS sugar transporter subunit IIB [Solobacterium sp.]